MLSSEDQPGRLRLFVSHRRALLRYASDIVGDQARAEDVVQDAYLRFAAAAPGRALDEPLGYLYRIVHNIALDGRRRQQSQSRVLADVEIDDRLQAMDERPSPETELFYRQQMQRMRMALADLPDRTRRAVELHRLDGLKTREVADRLGVSTTLAHGLITQGVAHCRRRLGHA